MKNTKRSRFFWLLGVLALVLGVMLTGCDGPTIIIIGSAVLGGIIGNAVGHVFTGIIGCIILVGILGALGGISESTSDKPSSNFSEGADDLFIELNNGRNLTIKDGYIWSSDGYRLGSIIGSDVFSRGRKIGRISGNEIYDLDGHLICHVENS